LIRIAKADFEAMSVSRSPKGRDPILSASDSMH
jgi:hypothetical protein